MDWSDLPKKLEDIKRRHKERIEEFEKTQIGIMLNEIFNEQEQKEKNYE